MLSLGVTARQLAIMAATIASGGVNPRPARRSSNRAGAEDHVDDGHGRILRTHGRLVFTTGLPAKTGVGGGIMGVVPGVMGLAAFAPPLDKPATRSRQRGAGLHRRTPQPRRFGTTRRVMAELNPPRRRSFSGQTGHRNGCPKDVILSCGLDTEQPSKRRRNGRHVLEKPPGNPAFLRLHPCRNKFRQG